MTFIINKGCEIYLLTVGVGIAQIHKLRLERLVLVGRWQVDWSREERVYCGIEGGCV